MNKQSSQPSFSENHVKELNERFGRLIKQLGWRNEKGTDRYKFEVDFAYAVNEISICPTYLKGKMFDKASGVVNNLINFLKQQKEETTEA